MTHLFDDAVTVAVLGHMNVDHADDSLLIARAFGPHRDIVGSTMIGFDGDGADWRVQPAAGEEFSIRVPWPGGAISERAEVRREIVALYDEACRVLGIEPRPHA